MTYEVAWYGDDPAQVVNVLPTSGLEEGEWPGPIDPRQLNYVLHQMIVIIDQRAGGPPWPSEVTLEVIIEVLQEDLSTLITSGGDQRMVAEGRYFIESLPYLITGPRDPDRAPSGEALRDVLATLTTIAAIATLQWEDGKLTAEMDVNQMIDPVLIRMFQATSLGPLTPTPQPGTLESAMAAIDKYIEPKLQKQLVSQTMQVLRGLKEQTGLEELQAISAELMADDGIRGQLERNGWAWLRPRTVELGTAQSGDTPLGGVSPAGLSPGRFVVSRTAPVTGKHVVIAPDHFVNPATERLLPWVKVEAAGAGEVIAAAKEAKAKPGDLILLDAAWGLGEGQIQQLLAASGLEQVRVLVGTPAQVAALPPAAFELFSGAEGSLPPVILLDVATGLEERSGETYTLLQMK